MEKSLKTSQDKTFFPALLQEYITSGIQAVSEKNEQIYQHKLSLPIRRGSKAHRKYNKFFYD